MKTKQVIVIRKDLNMSPGKAAAQAGHAVMEWLVSKLGKTNPKTKLFHIYGGLSDSDFSEEELHWLGGIYTKVCLQVDSEEELLSIYNKAMIEKLNFGLISDIGMTELTANTLTCVAIGPNKSEDIDKITKHLKLYK